MTEFYTKAIILERSGKGEEDERILLFTRDLGKIKARVKSSKAILSKLSPHLEVGRIADIRLVRKESYKLVDVLGQKTHFDREVIRFLDFIDKMTPYETQDLRLWHALEYVLTSGLMKTEGAELNRRIYRRLLDMMGFGSKFARCHNCDKPEISYFDPRDVIFLCSKSREHLKINEEEIVKI